jgi:hypothetical protein
MPQQGQIIPSYLHPHVGTYINDNTEFTETVAPAEEGLRSVFVFASPKGRDGVVLEQRSAAELVEEYGKPNFKLFGQPQLNAYAWLDAGQTKAWTMRVMPENAAYANLVILAKVKVDTTDTTPKMVVHFEAMQHSGLTSLDELAAQTELMTVTEPDVDGFRTFPIVAFNSLGRGVYGDAFRVRLNPSVQADKENDFRNYRVEVLELENTVTRKEVFTGTLFPDALDGMTSLFLSDIMNDAEDGSKKVGIHVVEENLTAIYNLYKAEIAPDTTITEEEFSILSGLTKAGTAVPAYQIDSTHVEAVALDNPEGIPLAGGEDGDFAYVQETLGDRDAAIDKAYIDAFSGKIDPAITSKRRTPSEVILDAGYSDDVKRELITLMTKRYDAYGFIDGGILNSTTDAIEWGEAMGSIGDRVFSKEFQHYRIRDPFSGKNIPVTITFFYARMLPGHFRSNGNQTPFVGEQFAKLTGAIKNTLKPVVDADDLETKEALYNLRLNYFQTLAENTYVRGTQSSSQAIWSDLSEENNMHVLLEIKRKLENMVAGLSYNFSEAEERKMFTEDANRLFEGYAGTKIRSGEVTFDMTPWEEERSILHCYMAIVFRTMSKRAIVEIDINKRV